MNCIFYHWSISGKQAIYQSCLPLYFLRKAVGNRFAGNQSIVLLCAGEQQQAVGGLPAPSVDQGILWICSTEQLYLVQLRVLAEWGKIFCQSLPQLPYYLRAVEEFGSLNGSTFYRQLVPVSGVSGGTKQSTLSSADPDKYLKDKAVGTYFYDYLGSDNVDPNSVTYSTSAPVQGQSITIQVSPRSNTYGGTISYQYQYSTNNGSTWTNIDSATTSTSKSFTIPSSATQFKARVRASDNMGFTSTDYVTGENLTVKEPTATYTISLTASSGGSVSGGGTYEEGTSVTVKATASSGYRFSRWTEGGATVSSNASYTFTVTQNRTLTAVFSKILPSYRITVTASPANGGTVSGGGSYESGRSATVRATPAADFLFVEWQEDGVAVSANPTYTFTVSKARTLTAVFKRKLSAYVGIEGKARKATNLYVGVDGKARKVVRAYIGVDGKAQKFL